MGRRELLYFCIVALCWLTGAQMLWLWKGMTSRACFHGAEQKELAPGPRLLCQPASKTPDKTKQLTSKATWSQREQSVFFFFPSIIQPQYKTLNHPKHKGTIYPLSFDQGIWQLGKRTFFLSLLDYLFLKTICKGFGFKTMKHPGEAGSPIGILSWMN